MYQLLERDNLMNIQSIQSITEEWLGDIEANTPENTLPFGVRVGCVKMASPRDSRFDIIRDLGSNLLDDIFSGKPLPSGELTFIFPERHMSLHEQKGLMSKLSSHPSAGDISLVNIITSSPFIVGDFSRHSIRILTWKDDNKYNGHN
jgi:hypothetical protein